VYLNDVVRIPALAIGLPIFLGGASGLLTRKTVDTWYEALKKPKGEPMRAAFPVVWTILYGSMGWASHLIISALDRSPSSQIRSISKTCLNLYWFQLLLNLSWTPIFFGLKKPLPALIDIITLTGTVYTLTAKLYDVDRRAFYVFLPYSAWLTYATYLNAGVFWLNGGRQKYLEFTQKIDRPEPKHP